MKFNIGIFGTFNVDNYGDVMFPEIFKRAMENRGLDFNLFLFSPGETCSNTLSPGAVVYSIEELAQIHSKHPLDAVIIGGGALIHYNRIPVKLPESDIFTEYNIYDSWFTPIEFAVRNNIKIIFNLPQIPYSFPETLKSVTTAAFKAANYISLRDYTSKKFLCDVFNGEECPEILVCPDSVCAISHLFEKEYLLNYCKNLISFEESYAVLQFNPQKPPEDDEGLINIIKKLNSQDLKVVLLPLGYTHNDDEILLQFNEKYKNICFTFEKKLNIFEMAAIIAGCDIYIGSSFHGAITAIAYGNTAISYNYIVPPTKNKEIFQMYNIGEFVANNSEQVLEVLNNFFCGQIYFRPEFNDVLSQVDSHFDKIYDIITSDLIISREQKIIPSMIELLPKNLNMHEKISLLTDIKSKTDGHVNNLNNIIDNLNNTIDNLNDTIDNLNNTIDNLNAKNDHLSMEKKVLIVKNESQADEIINLKDCLERTEFAYMEIANSFFWRLTAPIRRSINKFKEFAKKHYKLLVFMIYCKGFLKGGFKSAKKRVDDYLKYKVQIDKIAEKYDNCLTLHVPEDVRKEHKKFKFAKNIVFSVIVPLYNTPLDFLEQMIKSVELQTYENWELCLADGSDSEHNEVGKFCLKKAKTDSRIKYKKLSENKGISENTNECIKMATGDYIALFDHDDVLEPTALYEYARVICEKGADFIYCDEDKFDKFGGKLYDANYKPDFAIDNLRANNYICHFTVFEKSLLEQCGMFRKEFDGSQDHDIILRLTEKAKKIIHIPKVLYHWRVSAASVAADPYAKPYTIKAGINAVSEHLERVGLKGSVESSKIHPNIYRVKYDIVGNPLVSIIIPNYNHVEDLSRCINSILKLSTYSNYEIIIVENNSNKETFEYYESLKSYDNIKVVVYDREGGFNYSAINNFGVKYAKGEHYILLNNDIEIITPEWIEEMLMYSQRSDVGAVGAMLYYPNDTIQHAGVTIGVLTLAGHNFKHSQRGNPGYFGRAGYQQNVSAVTAACLMLPAKVYDEVKGLDESFEVAFNDIDLCMRIRKAGHLIVFTPFAELYHYESISRGDDSSAEKRARFVSEVSRFQTRWKKELDAGDPYYNPNLTLEREDFSLK